MKQHNVVISGSGLWTPPYSISNDELVEAFNAHSNKFNAENAAAIEAGEIDAAPMSDAAFIEKASGIKNRFAYIKDGILDPDRMYPRIPYREDDELSHQAEMAVAAARDAMKEANKTGADIDAVIVSCAHTIRYYPSIAIEVQHELGIEGFGFDMQVACSAATFALHRACEMLAAGTAKTVLCINPEMATPQVNFKDRDSHFIFGDVATAMILEKAETCTSEHSYQVINTKCVTTYSNNIRTNFSYLARSYDRDPFEASAMMHQEGRKVFKEVCPMATQHIIDNIAEVDLAPADISRWWLHQANINMNTLISRKLLGREASPEEAPIVLDRYANTGSAGSMVAFNLHHKDLQTGDYGLLCSFGAGYSIGSLLVQKR